ncbi:AT-hook motif nuclear-localized protein 23-like [Eucalyptus grandis]|uniref:AT-hook motif nuclear-localized protein 23-like n=1 Tax=Eucalyptus grandis TaxID=71139 RepID=UPI00192EB627|nr:AT-hook motif nuclear-localized protein 23-like [Eucalyptus grandis]
MSLWQQAAVGSVVTVCGRFEILSLSGSFLSSPAPPKAMSLTIFLEAGQVMGGSMVIKLILVGPVIIVALSFTNVAYERLLLEEEGQIHMPKLAAPQLAGRTRFRIHL